MLDDAEVLAPGPARRAMRQHEVGVLKKRMCQLWAEGELSAKEIGERLGFCVATVLRVVNGRRRVTVDGQRRWVKESPTAGGSIPVQGLWAMAEDEATREARTRVRRGQRVDVG